MESAVDRIQTSGDLFEILGSVEALKTLFEVFGGAVMKEIQLHNLCNKTVIPLLGLVSKLFQNFGPETALILVSCFKLFSAAIYQHLPASLVANIHNLMIFLKKILDLPLP